MNLRQRFLAIVVGAGFLFLSPAAFAILALNDNFVIAEDSTVVNIDPFANDIIDFDSWVFPTDGDFQLISGNGSISALDGITVTPAAGYVGLLEFEYTITDDTGSDTARIRIDVQPSPAPHNAVNDIHHVLENDLAIPLSILANDSFNIDNGIQILAPATSARGGSISVGSTEVLYQPPTDFTGIDTFVYGLQDMTTSVISQATVTVLVGVEPGQSVPIAGATHEEQDAIDVVTQICVDNPDTNLPCDAINALTDEQKRRLGQQISGRHAKAQSRTMRQIGNRQTNSVRSRLAEIRNGGNRISVSALNAAVYGEAVPLGQAFQGTVNERFAAGGAGDDGSMRWGAFLNGNLTIGESKNADDRPQYDQRGYNITLGLDYRFTDKLVLGAAAGYGQSDLEFALNRGTQDSGSVSLAFFGNYYPTDNWYIDGLAMWVNGDLDVERQIGLASVETLVSDTDSQQVVAALSTGYNLNWQQWQGALYGRIEYSDLTIDGYTERAASGSGAFALTIAEQNTTYVDTAIGARLGYSFSMSRGVIVPTLELEYVKQDEDDFVIESRFQRVPVAPRLNLNAEEPDTRYMNLAASVSAVFSGGRSGFFRYETVLQQDQYESDSYSLGFRIEF